MGNFPQWHFDNNIKKSGLNSQAQKHHHHKIDPISPENYDPWVYKFSKENMGTFPLWHLDDSEEGPGPNSQAQKHHKH